LQTTNPDEDPHSNNEGGEERAGVADAADAALWREGGRRWLTWRVEEVENRASNFELPLKSCLCLPFPVFSFS